MIEIAVLGSAGRMGKRLIALAPEHDCRVVAAVTRQQRELPGSANVLMDFSAPVATREWLKVCRDRKIPMLIGTTGLDKSDHDAIQTASRDIPVLQASNMSLGVAVLTKVARDAAKMLGKSDIEIVETHHRAKKDSPSGTALMLADALERAEGKPIPVHSLRLGDEIGRHAIFLALAGERLELTHVATCRDTFAHGALRAAKWLVGQKPGRFFISDVLGL